MSTEPINLQDEIADMLARPNVDELTEIIYPVFLHLYGRGLKTSLIFKKVSELIDQHRWSHHEYHRYLCSLSINAAWWQYVLIERYKDEYSTY